MWLRSICKRSTNTRIVLRESTSRYLPSTSLFPKIDLLWPGMVLQRLIPSRRLSTFSPLLHQIFYFIKERHQITYPEFYPNALSQGGKLWGFYQIWWGCPCPVFHIILLQVKCGPRMRVFWLVIQTGHRVNQWELASVLRKTPAKGKRTTRWKCIFFPSYI